MHDNLPVLIFLLIIVIGIWQMKPSPADKTRRHINHLLEELNSKYQHDRLNFGEEQAKTDNIRTFYVYDVHGAWVLKVEVVSEDNITVTLPDHPKMVIHYGSSPMKPLFRRIERELNDYHQYHVRAVA